MQYAVNQQSASRGLVGTRAGISCPLLGRPVRRSTTVRTASVASDVTAPGTNPPCLLPRRGHVRHVRHIPHVRHVHCVTYVESVANMSRVSLSTAIDGCPGWNVSGSKYPRSAMRRRSSTWTLYEGHFVKRWFMMYSER